MCEREHKRECESVFQKHPKTTKIHESKDLERECKQGLRAHKEGPSEGLCD